MLVGESDPEPWLEPAPLFEQLDGTGARVELLRLFDGRLVLKTELGNALFEILADAADGHGGGVPPAARQR